MKSLFAKVALVIAVSPAYIAAHHSVLSLNAQVARDRMPSAAVLAQHLDTTVSRKTVDTAIKRPVFPVIGRSAPQLRVIHWFNTPDWSPMKFGDGHIYILDFTAMWCGSCPATYPIMTELLKQYGSQGVRVIFVTAYYGLGEDHMSQVNTNEELAALPGYFARHNVTEPVAVYDNKSALLRDYSDDGNDKKKGMAIPKMVVIDGHGIVREVMTGWDAEKAREQVFATVAKLVQLPKTP